MDACAAPVVEGWGLVLFCHLLLVVTGPVTSTLRGGLFNAEYSISSRAPWVYGYLGGFFLIRIPLTFHTRLALGVRPGTWESLG